MGVHTRTLVTSLVTTQVMGAPHRPPGEAHQPEEALAAPGLQSLPGRHGLSPARGTPSHSPTTAAEQDPAASSVLPTASP